MSRIGSMAGYGDNISARRGAPRDEQCVLPGPGARGRRGAFGRRRGGSAGSLGRRAGAAPGRVTPAEAKSVSSAAAVAGFRRHGRWCLPLLAPDSRFVPAPRAGRRETPVDSAVPGGRQRGGVGLRTGRTPQHTILKPTRRRLLGVSEDPGPVDQPRPADTGSAPWPLVHPSALDPSTRFARHPV